MQKIPFKRFIPGISWFFVILVLICLPGKDVPKIGWLDDVVAVDKVVHVGIFFILDVLFCWPLHKSSFNGKRRLKYIILIAVAVSAWGLTTEYIQKFFISGRTFDLMDWTADSAGALLAFWFSVKKFSKVPTS